MQKWFSGNVLKEATVEASQAPSSDYVEITIARFSAARERMISLRSDVEDVECLLAKQGGGAEALADTQRRRALVGPANWKAVRDALTRCAERSPTTHRETRRMVALLLRRKGRAQVPRVCSVKRWHEFLNGHGPAADKYPSLSQFVWLSSACTTCGFAVLVRRFTHGVRDALLCAQGAPSDTRDRLYIADEDEGVAPGDDGSQEEEANGQQPDPQRHEVDGPADPVDVLVATQPSLTHIHNDSHRKLLVFLRFFMPSEVAVASAGDGRTVHRSSGFGVWLLSMLTALDAPLDPDTDRLVHDLFRRTCEQVRVLGDYKNVHGEHRGDLVGALAASSSTKIYRTYSSMEDVGREDVLALYSLLIVLGNFFRQNQNRLIPL
ncbi:hypothetical protein STCU_03027 [Strigomonas culicis]|nr:hypothetical protein STCU_03027 [Strigomonas culicis]|eukprot:EPY32000.1 hypothetical protein STCU_03027 [Strigomonas culicis]